YVYDKADRLIFTQDGEQRLKGEWTFSIPDVLGRVVLTGICKTANGSNITTGRFDNNLIKGGFSTTGTYKGYTLTLDAGTLTLGNYSILSANYYDNYDFRGMTGMPSTPTAYNTETGYGTWYGGDYTEANKYKNKGQLTGALTAQFNPDGTVSPDYLYSVMYYDNKGRLVQTKSNNHLAGIEEEYIAYNFTGQPVRKKHVHTGIDNAANTRQTEVYTYQYDHAGRLYNTRHRLNDGAETYLLQNRYDELGRLAKQGIGQVMPIAMSQPMLMAMAMTGMEESAEDVPEDATGTDTETTDKATEYIGSLGPNAVITHNAHIYANRTYTADLQFTLQQGCWITIEYPYSQVLGQTITVFFDLLNGVYHDMGVADEEDQSTATTIKIRYWLGAGTHNFNIYNPLVYDPQG
ncbi:hypothetical protein GGR21_004310, partial [Dysgonomonas hofstadii]|nr:hypothetical protein [Dysgonomonas hofstadii]